ncbi:hypothetical protein DVH24_036187 [Malus domestica]|uniref:SAC domain-containing protein n=1 Tax=Malus domestica TaxID=3750 RepID=A0A498IEJ7_MALDO|nr:hypothetical protein DVH24_036187 [Malus domestica]
MAKHHPNLIMCRNQPRITIGRLCEKKLCSCNNSADGSWDLSRLPCLSSDLDEVSVLQRGCEEFNCSGGKGFDSKKDEAYFVALLKTVQSTPGLYFSYETDITLNFQRRCKLVEGWMAKPIWKQTAQLKLKGLSATLTLVSRMCTRRLGTRMWRRGANLDGDVANFIETEQLVEIEGFQSSLLQIQGSIPLLWEQIVDLSYKPQLRIIIHEQMHGDERQLSTAFSAEMQNLPNVRYVSFDFHHVCGNSNFENLKVLYEQISEQFEQQGYFLVDAKGNILEEQKGVVRSNCIDCLDRTNVTQSYLAQMSLDAQLQRTGVLDSFESISMFAQHCQTFREYGILRVIYGKQTFGGIIKDGMSALSRYFLNNFQDGIRQYIPVASALLIGGLTLTSVTLQQVLCMMSTCPESAAFPSPTLLGNESDHLGLLDFKKRITKDPLSVMSSWNHSVHLCSWVGIICHHTTQRVLILDLEDKQLVGSIPPSIGNPTCLIEISLGIYLSN